MGKSVSTPAVPDYTAAAKEQGIQNQQAALQSATLSNPNMITPYGNQSVSYSQPTFNEAGYNKALQDYQTGLSGVDKNAFMRTGGGGGDAGDSSSYFDQSGYDAAIKNLGSAPDKSAYTTGGGVPTVTQTLTPQAQQTLDAQLKVQTALANLGQTGAANAQDVLSKPFNPNLPDIQMAVNPAGDLQSSVASAGNIKNNVDSAGNIQNNLTANQYGLANANTGANTYGLAGGINANNYGSATGINANQYGLATGNVPLQYSLNTSNLTQMPTNAGMSAQQAILSRLDPTIQAGDTSFKQALANQGLAPGTAAYDAAMRNREMSKNDLYNQAALQGINIDMAARQQGLNELNTTGTFGNQAQLAGAGLYNQAVAQNFGQGVTANQLQNAALGQNFNQGLAANQSQNAAIGQNFAQGTTADQLRNAAIGQNFNQGLTAQQATNAAQQQQYGQNLSNTELANAAQQQLYGQNLNNAQFANQAQQQQYGQNLNNAQFANQAIQQSLAQQSALRAQPLNEILGLMGGSQIQLPQFSGYQGTSVAPAPTFAGAQAQGQNAMQNYGIQQSGANATTQGLFSALGTAAMFAPKFSDRRLKSNIVQIGTHPLGIGIYEYDIFGNRERGVMADEVAQVMPDAIIPHSSGYMMVNYGKL